MALACVLSRAQLGFDAPLVSVEVHLDRGLPQFMVVGLPAPVVRESRERVRAALVNSGFEFPAGRITVNLAPVELAKEGGRFDLPIAVGVLLAAGQLPASGAPPYECYGELGLGGELKPVPGLFLAAWHAARAGHRLYIPQANLEEAGYAGHADAQGLQRLAQLREIMGRPGRPAAPRLTPPSDPSSPSSPPDPPGMAGVSDLSNVAGQWQAKRALLIAAAGDHSLLMVGPPGSGKGMLAARLPALLPPLSAQEAMEVAAVASMATLRFDRDAWRRRPFRSPHHTASAQAVIGGGARLRPGEISLAHGGVLFLDELPEFDRRVLESLREPLESGVITIARAAGQLTLPARFQLVAAMNPCPCGYLGDSQQPCRCTPPQIARYRQRISGPLLDRIDLRITVARVGGAELAATAVGAAGGGPPAAVLLQQAAAARQLQWRRGGCANARLPARLVGECCALQPQARRLLARSRELQQLSARGLHRLLRVSRTIADLAHSDGVAAEHLAEALQLRRALETPPAAAPAVISGPATPCSRHLP